MNNFLEKSQKFLVGIWFLRLLDIIFYSFHIFYISQFFPLFLATTPATGGDTGSHFWPVYVLREYGLPNFNLRPWNPGNFAGEPLLVHYFPLPFVLMALMSYLMPSGLAFNLGTFLPIILLPLAIRWGVRHFLRGLGHSFVEQSIAGSVAGVLSWSWLLNASNSMWGGNIYSVFAGQFAHQWAFVFFSVFIGFLPGAFKLLRWPLIASAIIFASMILTHAYVAIFAPFTLLYAFIFFQGSWYQKFKSAGFICLLGSFLSVWFWYPLIDNSKWTTPYAFEWLFSDHIKEILPYQMSPQIVLASAWILILLFIPKIFSTSWRSTLFWVTQLTAGVLAYSLFFKVGLVDVRALPQIQLSVTIIAAIACGSLYLMSGYKFRWAFAIVIIVFPFFQIFQVKEQLATLRGWAEWNYTGWTSKPAYAALQALSKRIEGDFNEPRVAFEHDNGNNIAGTPRVFEMLPYFSGRSVADGVYMQSTILAPMFFYHQATISVNPSCPFPNYGCTAPDLDRAVELGSLLGINSFIIQSQSLLSQADKNSRLQLQFREDSWNVYKTAEHSVSYVEIPNQIPRAIKNSNWRQDFWNWFTHYKKNDDFIFVDNESGTFGTAIKSSFTENFDSSKCDASVDIDFNKLKLHTSCPGHFHILKFAYHSSWRPSGGETLYLTSPGFIGIIPESASTVITFGRSPSWILASILSFAALIALSTYLLRQYIYHLRSIKNGRQL